MRSMGRAARVAGFCLFSKLGSAEDLATAYVNGSTSLTGGVTFHLTSRENFLDVGGAAGASVRRMVSGWAFEGRVSAGFYASDVPQPLGPGLTVSENLSIGGAVGRSFVLGERVALTPTASVSAGGVHLARQSFDESVWSFGLRAAIELPLTVFISRRVYYEPYVDVGVRWTSNAEPMVQAWFGQRVGFIF